MNFGTMDETKLPVRIDIPITPTLTRTPPKQTMPVKRKSDDEITRTVDDLYKLMKNGFKSQSNEFKSEMHILKTDLTNTIEEKIAPIKTDVCNVKSRLEVVEQKLMDNDRKNADIQKMFNIAKQEKLQNSMEIVGAEITPGLAKTTLKSEAIKIIKSFKIEVNNEDISHVSMLTFNNGSTNSSSTLIVEFNKFDTKKKIMDEKKKIRNGTNKVYFNHRLTADNRKLMAKARKVAKDKNFRTYLHFSKIYIKKSDTQYMIITCDEDIEKAAAWESNGTVQQA